MLDLIKRLSNKNAYLVTKRLLERKDRERINLGETSIDANLYSTAKVIYKGLLANVRGIDKKEYDELSLFIENIETDEQFIVNYLKSVIWSYNKKVDEELDDFWRDANDIMSNIGK
jgi:hypothetical protein